MFSAIIIMAMLKDSQRLSCSHAVWGYIELVLRQWTGVRTRRTVSRQRGLSAFLSSSKKKVAKVRNGLKHIFSLRTFDHSHR